jgi:hypothetical protein
MTDSIMLEILKGIQADVADIKSTLSAMRSEIDGGFHRMAGTDGRVEGLSLIVAAQGRRITALERKS